VSNVPAAPSAAGVARRVLVIKHGALGDFVQALGSFAAIRRHHRSARVTLLTTTPYVELARGSGHFDEIWVDDRPPLWSVWGLIALRRRLRTGGFDRVYDLQTKDRTALYFRLLGPGPRPEWSGIARGCSHPHRDPDRVRMHTLDREAEQLRLAGIDWVPPPDLSWLTAEVGRLTPPGCYVLMVPGGSAHRPAKRWPAERYGALARELGGRGYASLVLGAAAERGIAARIRKFYPAARDLTGSTTIAEVAALARGAAGAVGNDTGPMHVIAAAGCPTTVLFSAHSDPRLCAPRGRPGGPPVVILERARLADLPTAEVSRALVLRAPEESRAAGRL